MRSSALRQIREEASANETEARRWDLLTRTLDVMIMPPRFAAYPACEDALWRSLQRAMEGAVSPKEAVADGARQIAALLDRERPSPQNVV